MNGLNCQIHTTLGELSSLITSGSRGWADFYSETGALFLRMTNLPKEGICILLKDNKFVLLPSSSTEGKRTNVQQNDILVSITAELGKIGFVENDLGEAYVNQHVALVRISSLKAHPKFVAYYLAAPPQRKLWQSFNDAGAKAGLNLQTISKFPVTLPSFTRQTAIASLLSTWDLSIEKTERLISAKENGYSWLIRTMIYDKCVSWEHRRADKIFKSISEKDNGGGELLSVTQDRGVIPRTMLDGRVMSPEGGTESYKLIREGDFAISLRSFQGGIEYSKYQGLISPAYTVLRPKVELHNEFFRHFFKSYLFIEKYLRIAVIGIRDGKQISIPDFMTVRIPLPPIEQQKQIAGILNTARHEIDLLKKQADALRRQKRGLMQKLLTGEWRVKIDKEVS